MTTAMTRREIDREYDESGGRDEKGKTAQSEPPKINTVKNKDLFITGYGVAGAAITVFFPGGHTAGTVVTGYGDWQVNIPAGVKLTPNNIISAVQTEHGKTQSIKTETKVTN